MGAVVNSGLLVVALVLATAVGYLVAKFRSGPSLRKCREQLAIKDRSMEQLRQELTEDKMVNRRLRYQMASQPSMRAGTSDDVKDVDLQRARTEVDRLTAELAVARERVNERDEAIRVARFTIKEIRQQIEESGSIGVPAEKQAASPEAQLVGERLATIDTSEVNLRQ